MAIIFCLAFIGFTTSKYKKLTGYSQFSPFSGWQLSNNAMYAYRYVESERRKPVPIKFQALDKIIRAYFDSTRDVKKYPTEAIKASTFYMWSKGMPLYIYRNKILDTTKSTEFKLWASMGPFYANYGTHLIKQYPGYFLKYFIWPNAMKYYAPPVEFLKYYNSGKDSVTEIAKYWFNYNSTKISTRTKSANVAILDVYPILSGVINLMMFFLIGYYISIKGWKGNWANKGILIGVCFWTINAAFTIVSSSAALRFQTFPMSLALIFDVLLIDWLINHSIEMPVDNQLATSRDFEIKKSSSNLVTTNT
jgi:hypothetical protein